MVFEKTLVTMVKGIRGARGQEEQYIQQSIQEIKQELQSSNLHVKSMAVLKLAYLNMIGYDIMWASFQIVDCMSRCEKMSLRRPAYLAAAFCFQEKNDLGLMLINHFKKNLMSGNKTPTELGIALSNLAVICTPDMGRELINDLIALLSSNKPYIRKKVVLCMFRLFLRYPLGLRAAFPKLKERLTDEDQGVLTACVNTFLELTRKNARNYLILVPHFFTLLTQTNNNWLLIKLLKVFAQLCPLEPRLASKLATPLTDILTTTRAKSVEFEVIRAATKCMPHDAPLTKLAFEKVKPYLFSADRNLRYLGLEIVDDFLKRYSTVPHSQLPLPAELHETILEAIEEADQTIRVVALSILDKIVSKESFPKIAEKLMQMSSNLNTGGEEYVKTLLTMGEQEQYELVEDFGWYILTLAEIAKKKHSEHSQRVADQFCDICARVEGVRPYAVSVAQILLLGDGTSRGNGIQNCAPAMLTACAWALGEYPEHIEEAYLKSILDQLLHKNLASMPSTTQLGCLWAAIKILCKVGVKEDEEKFVSFCDALQEAISELVLSPHVEVSERATMAFYLLEWCAKRKASLQDFYPTNELDPLGLDDEDTVPQPEGMELDVPFFEDEPAHTVEDPAEDATYADLPNYQQDLVLLQQQQQAQQMQNGTPQAANGENALFLLKQGVQAGVVQGADQAPPSPPKPVDPLAAMREKLQQNKQQFAVKRKEKPSAGSPGPPSLQEHQQALLLQQQQQQQAMLLQHQQLQQQQLLAQQQAMLQQQQQQAALAAQQQQPNALPAVSEKELQDFLNKRWTVWTKDENLCVYCCIKNRKSANLRVDLRVEKLNPQAVISDVKLKASSSSSSALLPASGGGPPGEFVLVPGAFSEERSGKLKAAVNLAGVLESAAGVTKDLSVGDFEVCYVQTETKITKQVVTTTATAASSSTASVKLDKGPGDDLLDLLDAPSPASAPIDFGDEPKEVAAEAAVEQVIEKQEEVVVPKTVNGFSPLRLELPATVVLEATRWSEDEIASYIGANAKSHLVAQAGEVLQQALSSATPDAIANAEQVVLPKLVAKAAAVCNFHGLQQATPSASTPGGTSVAGPRKFLLVSQACGHKGAAEAPHLVALCAGAVKEGMLNVRVTVKGGSQEEVEAVKGELAAALKEAVAAAV